MNRDSKGRFCKADNKAKKEIKSTKIPFLSKKHIKKEELEWSDLGKGINLDEIDEPIIIRVKFQEKDRFHDCVNNACVFDRLDWDERAKFMGYLLGNTDNICDVITNSECMSNTLCSDCFSDWFFNMYTPEVFHKILGD